MLKKIVFPILFLILTGVFLKWLLTPGVEVGQVVEIQSRDHIKVGEVHPAYNSNPPTSGWHYNDPVSAGIYITEFPDENLIHSLEHGYVIISYNCNVKEESSYKLVPKVLAHGEELESTPSAESSSSAITLGEDCHNLQDGLRDLVNANKGWKLILTPRTKLEFRVVLTAWGRIDKFNNFDKERIERFIKTYLNQGPEKTDN